MVWLGIVFSIFQVLDVSLTVKVCFKPDTSSYRYCNTECCSWGCCDSSTTTMTPMPLTCRVGENYRNCPTGCCLGGCCGSVSSTMATTPLPICKVGYQRYRLCPTGCCAGGCCGSVSYKSTPAPHVCLTSSGNYKTCQTGCCAGGCCTRQRPVAVIVGIVLGVIGFIGAVATVGVILYWRGRRSPGHTGSIYSTQHPHIVPGGQDIIGIENPGFMHPATGTENPQPVIATVAMVTTPPSGTQNVDRTPN